MSYELCRKLISLIGSKVGKFEPERRPQSEFFFFFIRDKNDNVWREDSGLLIDKTKLPVKQLRFGDTGHTGEQGYHTLGKIKCYGIA